MLHRAATNAYSWWWASHIRTKQSKWLQQSLQDMEEVMGKTLNIIDNRGDSFAERAEMYYRKRPELVSFVEEAFRAYRALAEKYDHLSKELQSANRTIATVCPEQVQYRIDEYDDVEESVPRPSSSSPDRGTNPGIPKAPDIPKKDSRGPPILLSKKRSLRRKLSSVKSVSTTSSSGLSKVEALAEIDKLQKEILALQTEEEFVRSLYENSYEKYWEIEDQITEMQKRVCSLEDEFGISTIIEDDEARVLMATTALNSCKDTLAKLQEVQAQSSEEAKEAYERVKEAHDKFESLRDQFFSKHASQQNRETEPKGEEEELASLEKETHEHDVGLLPEMIMEKLEEDSVKPLGMTEMAERIDDLVSKVVTLETAVTSQTVLVKKLRSEADELQKDIQILEEDKDMLIEDSEKTYKKLKELEEELTRVKVLNRSVKRQDNSLQTHFTEAGCNLEYLSGRMDNVKLDEEGENIVFYNESVTDGKLIEESKKPDKKISTDNLANMNDDVNTTEEKKEDYDANLGDVKNEDDKSNLKDNVDFGTEEVPELTLKEKVDLLETMSTLDTELLDLGTVEEKDQPNLKQMLDDTENIPLEECISVLENYKDAKVMLNDVEDKSSHSILELAFQVRELKDVVTTKDKEIKILQRKLSCSETYPVGSPRTTLIECKYTPQEALLQNAAQGLEIPSSVIDTSIFGTSFAEQQQHTENTGNIGNSTVRANQVEQHHPLSTLEKKIRSDIDYLLEENLEFWLRFSTSVHQIRKFQHSIQDLKGELKKVKEENMSKGNSNLTQQSEMKAISGHLREIKTELSLWLEHTEILQEELHGRHTLLCSLQDGIARAAHPDSASQKAGLGDYQAAKFQGEVLNLKQESNRIYSELQAGLRFVKGLKNEVEKMLGELSPAIEVRNHGDSHEHTKHSSGRARAPFKSFLFGIKLKKQRQSTMSCASPVLEKQHSDIAAASNTTI